MEKISEKSIPDLLKTLGWSPLACFVFVSLVATLVAVPIVRETGVDIDIHDPGVLIIIAITAFLVYGSIWIFIKRITSHEQS